MSVRPTIDPACSTSDAPAPMIAAVIDARPRDIGFKVRRLLPSRARRLVGPFVFSITWAQQFSLQVTVCG